MPHYFAVFLLVAHGLYAGFVLWQQRWSRSVLSQTLVMFGLTALLFVPWLPTLFSRLGDDPSYWPGALKLNEAIRKVAISFTVGETVKDFSAAAENLRKSARDLQQEVGQFKVSD